MEFFEVLKNNGLEKFRKVYISKERLKIWTSEVNTLFYILTPPLPTRSFKTPLKAYAIKGHAVNIGC